MIKAKKKVKPKLKKKIVKKIVKKVKKEGKLVGKITHYFSNIRVAVIKLALPLKVGDVIKIVGGEKTNFEQKVGSLQIDHKSVRIAKKKISVGIRVNKKVHEGYKVYKA